MIVDSLLVWIFDRAIDAYPPVGASGRSTVGILSLYRKCHLPSARRGERESGASTERVYISSIVSVKIDSIVLIDIKLIVDICHNKYLYILYIKA